MLKLLFVTLIMLSSLGAYSIQFDKSFEIAIKPDTITTHINISIKKQSEKEVLEKLALFSTFIDSCKGVEKKGGNYSVYPDYRYENNHRYKNGYQGTMGYQVSAKKPEDLNIFIASLHDKKKDFDVDISLSSVSWQLSPEQKEGKLDKLRLDAILWVNSYATTLSSQIKSTCKVSNISINPPSFFYPQAMMEQPIMESKSMANDNAPTPQQDTQKITINPHFELECK